MLLSSFALFYFEFEGNFQVQAPGGLYSEGRFNGGILRYEFRGLTHGGAYFRNFTVVITLRAEVRGTQRQMHSNRQRYKIYICLVTLGKLESFQNYKGFSISPIILDVM